VDGSGNNKILKVQWKNLGIQGGPAGNFVNLQVWLHKATGIFEVYYGPSSSNNASGYTASTGPNVGLFYSRQDFTKMFEKIWITQSPSSYVIDSAKNFSFAAMHGVPANGTVYRFIPKHIATSAGDIQVDGTYLISPNPAHNELVITSPHNKAANVQLTGMDGKIIHTGKLLNSKLVIETATLPAGTYLLNINSSAGSYSQKIVVQH
jgi:hypothetical protein